MRRTIFRYPYGEKWRYPETAPTKFQFITIRLADISDHFVGIVALKHIVFKALIRNQFQNTPVFHPDFADKCPFCKGITMQYLFLS